MDVTKSLKKEPVKLFTKKDYEGLAEYAQSNQANLDYLWLNEKKDVYTFLKYAMLRLTSFKKFIEQSPELFSVFRIGEFFGAVESYEGIAYKQQKDNLAYRYVCQFGHTTKYFNSIVKLLETNGPMTHTDISEKLGLIPSTLSEAMKRIVLSGAVYTEKSGKYKLYHLTDLGIQYGQALRRKERVINSNEELLQLVRNRIEGFEDQEDLEKFRKDISNLCEISVISRNDIVSFDIRPTNYTGFHFDSMRIDDIKGSRDTGRFHLSAVPQEIQNTDDSRSLETFYTYDMSVYIKKGARK